VGAGTTDAQAQCYASTPWWPCRCLPAVRLARQRTVINLPLAHHRHHPRQYGQSESATMRDRKHRLFQHNRPKADNGDTSETIAMWHTTMPVAVTVWVLDQRSRHRLTLMILSVGSFGLSGI